MATNDNRIPSQRIVKGAPVILEEDGVDALFMDPSSYIAIKGGVLQKKYLAGFPGESGGDDEGGNPTGPSGPTGPTGPTAPKPPIDLKDVVHLTDIESITYEQYYENGLTKYKCFIKIRNNSLNKNNVEGVDARIYNPKA